MMENLIIYFGFVFVFIFIDALMALGLKKRYRIMLSIISSIFWPITASMVIYLAVVSTKEFPDANTLFGDDE